MPEYLDLYRRDGTRTGQTIERGQRVPPGRCVLLVSILTLNNSGEILLTKRAKEKKYACRWEITGGCVQSGETAAQGAMRELSEETGIVVTEQELEYRGRYCRSDYIHAFFLVRKDVPLGEIRLLAGETDDAKWVQPAEYLRLAEAHKTIPHHTAVIVAHYPELFRESGLKRRTKL